MGKDFKNLLSKKISNKKDPKDENLLRKSIELHMQGNIKEAKEYYERCISQKLNHPILYSNYALLLKDQGDFENAEKYIRDAINLDPKNISYIFNLGIILKGLGKLSEAQRTFLKILNINSNHAKTYFALTTLNSKKEKISWQKTLFSEEFLNKQTDEGKMFLHFARSNILHNEKNFSQSSISINLANKIKKSLQQSNLKELIYKTDLLKNEYGFYSELKTIVNKPYKFIFIVGMPRCGSTLLEAIISMNKNIYNSGETTFIDETYLEFRKKRDRDINDFKKIFLEKFKNKLKNSNIILDKSLYNYQFAGLISKLVPESLIVHCIRNPLDNILSIYRTNFANGNQYSSSIEDIVKVYLDHDQKMDFYKNSLRNIIEINYDLLVKNPEKEIRKLIENLEWEWDDKYLDPQNNKRAFSTASNVQIRSPIYKSSINGWKNYKNELDYAIKIFKNLKKFKYLFK
jgi:tetratricopeptide (TPR) repeat protein